MSCLLAALISLYNLDKTSDWLGCQPNPPKFHHAGNDAVYPLYAMLRLAIKRANDRAAELNPDEARRLDLSRPIALPVRR